MAPVLAGALGGAAGAAASGVVGSATGAGSFSWRNVAAGAITGAITAGIAQGIGPVGGETASVGRLLKEGRTLAAAGMALGNAAAGYVGNKVAGVEGTSFSWRNIAGSAVGSMLSSAAFNRLGWDQPGAFEKSGNFGQTLVTGFVGGLVSAHTQKAFGADVRINEGRMSLDAFGNALGNALGGAINDARERRQLEAKLARKARMPMDPANVSDFNDRLNARLDAAMDRRIEHLLRHGQRDVPMPASDDLQLERLGTVTVGPVRQAPAMASAPTSASAVSEEEQRILFELARDEDEQASIAVADGRPFVQAMAIARAQQGPKEMFKTFLMAGPGLGASFALGGGPLWARVLGASPGLWSAGNDIADGNWLQGFAFGGLEVVGIRGIGPGARMAKEAAIADATQASLRITQTTEEAALAHAIADGRLSRLFGDDQAAVARWFGEINSAWATARRDWLAPIAAGKMHETLTMAAVRSSVIARSGGNARNFAEQVTLRVTDSSGKSSIIRADGLERLGGNFVLHESKFSLSKSLTEGTEGLRAMFTTRQRHAFDALQQPGVKVEVLGDKLAQAGLSAGSKINVLPKIQMHVNSAIGPLTRGWP